MTTDPKATFFELSQLLTGFSAKKLTLTDLNDTYYDLASAQVPTSLNGLLEAFEKAAGGTPVAKMSPAERQRVGTLLYHAGAAIKGTAQAILALWYLGLWYQALAEGNDAAGDGFVVSDQAYINGLSWQVMQSHAMGNSTFTFGYWAEAPPALDAFTGQPST